ncbi:unnamed protein product [Tuber aestivum]|uniref:Uncharacterized protein n=1 Tax=Tuber aestivum TaxID=59557 RepID=A0A292Q5X5_9PEZI|nr:unnamed protein product [Tuber aestivum]
MSLSPNTHPDLRVLVPLTEHTENTDGPTPAPAPSDHHLHPPPKPLDLPSSPEDSFSRHPPQPLATFDGITSHTATPTEPPAMPEVMPADDLEAEDDDGGTYREIQARVDQIHRTRHDTSRLTERRVLKVPRVRKHHSSSARRERKIRSRSRPSDMDPLSRTEEAYSREQRLHGPIPMQEGKPREEPGDSRHGKAPGPLVDVPEIRVECTGESRPVTPPKVEADAGRMDWCQQTPPHQTIPEECPMDWSGNSPPAPAAPPPPPPSDMY